MMSDDGMCDDVDVAAEDDDNVSDVYGEETLVVRSEIEVLRK